MRSVIVTGGTKGLGREIAARLAANSYHPIVIARHMTEETGPENRTFVPFDLGEIEKIPQLVKDLFQKFGPIHGLVNNAATGPEGVLATMPNSEIESAIRLNVLSPVTLTKYVVRRMMADGGGRVVNIASIAAFTGYSGLSVYSATKSSLIGFTRSLAREVGRTGVTVNAVAPGFLDTDMTRHMGEERREQIVRRSALRQLTSLSDVADTVEFLLSDKAKGITGSVFTVDAGATA